VTFGMEPGVWHSVWSSVVIIQALCLCLLLSEKLICFVLNHLCLLLVFCCKTTCHSLITSEGAHVLRHARVDVPFTHVSTFMR
jgi:hypothetical protein